MSPDAELLASLAGLVDKGAVQLRIAADYPLREVRDPRRHFRSRGLPGKVVLTF